MCKGRRSLDSGSNSVSLALVGVRRVSWVKITVGDALPARCEVGGLGHRRPIIREVPLHVATSLAAQGVPTVVRRRAA